jgi:hypothetical protein
MASQSSEYLGGRNVRHKWVCDGCNYRFETLIRFNVPGARDGVAPRSASLSPTRMMAGSSPLMVMVGGVSGVAAATYALWI